MRRSKFAVAMFALVAVSACASLGRGIFQEPIVNFKDLRVRGLGLSGGSLDVYLNIYNPNQFRLDATRLTYRPTVGERAAASKESTASRRGLSGPASSRR